MKRWLFSVLCIACLVPGSVRAGDRTLSPGLAMVSPDSLFFAHVRMQDVYKSGQLKELRDTFAKAGAQALKAYDSRFFPAPSSLDHVTVIVPDFSGKPVIILTTTKAIDRESFLKFTVPGTEKQENGKFGPLFVDANKDVELWFADNKTLVFGPQGAVRQFQKTPKAATGNLSDAIKLANSGKAVVAAFNVEAVPAAAVPALLKEVPPQMQAMIEPLLKARTATVAVDVRGEGQIDLRLAFANAGVAGDADLAMRDVIKLGRTFIDKGREEWKKKIEGGPGGLEELAQATAALFALGMLNRADEYLASGPVRKEGNSLLASVKFPSEGQYLATYGAIGVALFVPAVQKVRVASERIQSVNNLKQLMLAMHSFHDVHNQMPTAATVDRAKNDGKPLLSWRVAMLPYIEQLPLYNEFHHDEPWDSPHNIKLLPKMPKIFAPVSGVKTKQPYTTFYQVIVGPGTAFEKNPQAPWKNFYSGLGNIPDGASNTIGIVEAADPVPWTKPQDLVYNPKGPLPKIGGTLFPELFNCALLDGSVRWIKPARPGVTPQEAARRGEVSEETLRNAITCNDGVPLGQDWNF